MPEGSSPSGAKYSTIIKNHESELVAAVSSVSSHAGRNNLGVGQIGLGLSGWQKKKQVPAVYARLQYLRGRKALPASCLAASMRIPRTSCQSAPTFHPRNLWLLDTIVHGASRFTMLVIGRSSKHCLSPPLLMLTLSSLTTSSPPTSSLITFPRISLGCCSSWCHQIAASP